MILTLDKAKELIGQPACLSCVENDNQIAVHVTEVVENASNDMEWESFSVILSLDDSSQPFQQGIFSLDSKKYKNDCIFISPNSIKECEIVMSRRR